MTEREKQNEEIKQELRNVAIGFHQVIERFCKYVDDAEALLQFHERNTMTLAEKIDDAQVIG